MGSANITPIQGEEIVQAIKQEYNDYYSQHSNNDVNNDELKELILKKYQTTLMNLNMNNQQSSSATPIASARSISATSNEIVGKRGIQKNSNGSKSLEARPKMAARLRSFDGAPKQKKQKEKTTLETNHEMDSWDSVKGQPACLLCAMVFATPEKLATHTKYSTIHASNLKKLEISKFSTPNSPSNPHLRIAATAADPSTPYRVLYTGSKFFWRSKHNIDFHIYHHIDASVLEIIGYDSATQTELPRLYLDEGLVSDSISQDDIYSRIKNNKDSNTKYLSVLENPANAQKNSSKIRTHDSKDDNFVTINDDRFDSNSTEQLDALLYDEEKRLIIASRLISKLQYQHVSMPKESLGAGRNGTALIPYELSFIDPQLQSSILTEKPPNVTPVVIPRRRHSTQAEISESFRSLSTMQMELHEITSKAEKMSHLIRASIELFTQHHFSPPKQSQYVSPRMKSQLPLDKQSAESLKKKEVRERWRYAIHKVVLRNALGQTVEMLKQKGQVTG